MLNLSNHSILLVEGKEPEPEPQIHSDCFHGSTFPYFLMFLYFLLYNKYQTFPIKHELDKYIGECVSF